MAATFAEVAGIGEARVGQFAGPCDFESEYGGAEGAPSAPRRRADPPPAPLAGRIVRNDPGVREAQMLRAWIAPTQTWGRDEADRAHDLLDPGASLRARAERAADAIRARWGQDAILKGRALR